MTVFNADLCIHYNLLLFQNVLKKVIEICNSLYLLYALSASFYLDLIKIESFIVNQGAKLSLMIFTMYRNVNLIM